MRERMTHCMSFLFFDWTSYSSYAWSIVSFLSFLTKSGRVYRNILALGFEPLSQARSRGKRNLVASFLVLGASAWVLASLFRESNCVELTVRGKISHSLLHLSRISFVCIELFSSVHCLAMGCLILSGVCGWHDKHLLFSFFFHPSLQMLWLVLFFPCRNYALVLLGWFPHAILILEPHADKLAEEERWEEGKEEKEKENTIGEEKKKEKLRRGNQRNQECSCCWYAI